MTDVTDPWKAQLEAFGAFVRTQRQLAKLSLREMAELAMVSNPYLSQIERGLHEPSIRVIRSIAKALDISAETLLAQVGLIEEDQPDGRVPGATEAAIQGDPYLSEAQRQALLAVYRSYVAESRGRSPKAGDQPETTPDAEA
ncbi:MAG TPA: helix-turn-helix transcriptional regulator [Acidimicrobiia bacterium]|jgi:transcriptional regulator with XRE-family HTH domain